MNMNIVFAVFSILLLLALLGLTIYGSILFYAYMKDTLNKKAAAKAKSFESAEEPEDADLIVLDDDGDQENKDK